MKALEFSVKDINETGVDLHELPVPPMEIGLEIEEGQLVKPIHGNIQLARRVNEVYVKADFSTSIEIMCRRCTERFGTDIATRIELQFYPTEKPEQVEPWLLDVGERYYSGEVIDLTEEVCQALTLEIPIWALCSESCEGLCPHCGADLNVTHCDCYKPEAGSSPFAALVDILDTSKRAVGK